MTLKKTNRIEQDLRIVCADSCPPPVCVSVAVHGDHGHRQQPAAVCGAEEKGQTDELTLLCRTVMEG